MCLTWGMVQSTLSALRCNSLPFFILHITSSSSPIRSAELYSIFFAYLLYSAQYSISMLSGIKNAKKTLECCSFATRFGCFHSQTADDTIIDCFFSIITEENWEIKYWIKKNAEQKEKNVVCFFPSLHYWPRPVVHTEMRLWRMTKANLNSKYLK